LKSITYNRQTSYTQSNTRLIMANNYLIYNGARISSNGTSFDTYFNCDALSVALGYTNSKIVMDMVDKCNVFTGLELSLKYPVNGCLTEFYVNSFGAIELAVKLGNVELRRSIQRYLTGQYKITIQTAVDIIDSYKTAQNENQTPDEQHLYEEIKDEKEKSDYWEQQFYEEIRDDKETCWLQHAIPYRRNLTKLID
jgi:hypothetical protein